VGVRAWSKRGIAAAAGLVLVATSARASADDGTPAAAERSAPAGDTCAENLRSLSRDVDIAPSVEAVARLGECQITLGRIVEGVGNLKWVLRQHLPDDASLAALGLQMRARRTVESAEPRIASLKIAVAAPRAAEVTVEIDGNPVPFANLANARRVDPGEHVVVARAAGYGIAVATVRLRDGAADAVALTLEPEPPPLVAGSVAPARDVERDVEMGAPPAARVDRTPAYVALTAGGVSLTVGGVLGVVSIQRSREASAQCAGSVCPASAEHSLESARTLGYATTVAFIAGAIGAGVGTVLLLWPSRDAERRRAVRVTPHVGLGSAGVSGSF
jgi:hypothetical protein